MHKRLSCQGSRLADEEAQREWEVELREADEREAASEEVWVVSLREWDEAERTAQRWR